MFEHICLRRRLNSNLIVMMAEGLRKYSENQFASLTPSSFLSPIYHPFLTQYLAACLPCADWFQTFLPRKNYDLTQRWRRKFVWIIFSCRQIKMHINRSSIPGGRICVHDFDCGDFDMFLENICICLSPGMEEQLACPFCLWPAPT